MAELASTEEVVVEDAGALLVLEDGAEEELGVAAVL